MAQGPGSAKCKTFNINTKDPVDVNFLNNGELTYAHFGARIKVKGTLKFDCDGKFQFDGTVHISDNWTFKETGWFRWRLTQRHYYLAYLLETKYGYNAMNVVADFAVSFRGPPVTFDFDRLQ